MTTCLPVRPATSVQSGTGSAGRVVASRAGLKVLLEVARPSFGLVLQTVVSFVRSN